MKEGHHYVLVAAIVLFIVSLVLFPDIWSAVYIWGQEVKSVLHIILGG